MQQGSRKESDSIGPNGNSGMLSPSYASSSDSPNVGEYQIGFGGRLPVSPPAAGRVHWALPLFSCDPSLLVWFNGVNREHWGQVFHKTFFNLLADAEKRQSFRGSSKHPTFTLKILTQTGWLNIYNEKWGVQGPTKNLSKFKICLDSFKQTLWWCFHGSAQKGFHKERFVKYR